MTERVPKIVILAGVACSLPILALLAYSRPAYFTNTGLLVGVILTELLAAALFTYRRSFLPIVIVAFLLAGTGLPIPNGIWIAGRWVVLGVGALTGCFVMLKDRVRNFTTFHALAIFSVFAAFASAAVSRYPTFAVLKSGSLFLLFLYAGSGARLAAVGRERRFVAGLLLGCEIFMAATVALYFVGIEFMGNPNSLGAVLGVVIAPVLLWGTIVAETPFAYHRRILGYAAAMYMVFHSMSRAGLGAALIACTVLCLALRRYRMLAQGVVILLILSASMAILNPEAFSQRISSLTSSVLYKDKDPSQGLFGSRKTPWQEATESIKKHLWFGSGFGTTDNGLDASEHLGTFTTAEGTSSENGSSYLAILSWVGIVGVLPFVFLMVSVLGKVLRTCLWMLNTGNPYHPAVPLALITLAGVTHAGLEDWLFAPGYYLCVFFWSMAFVLEDLAPWAPLPSFTREWRPWLIQQEASRIAPSR